MSTESNPNIETEIKFRVPDPAVFDRLKGLSTLGDFQLAPVDKKEITDRYLDTAGRHMLAAGYACRIRTNQKQQQKVTIKSLTPSNENVHRREELETPIDSDQPSAWPESEAKELLLSIVGDASLETLFILHQTRHPYEVLLNQALVIECSLDEVSLQDAAEDDYYELEAELIESGTEEDLAKFGALLEKNWSLEPDHQSKFERAFIATFGESPLPQRKDS